LAPPKAPFISPFVNELRVSLESISFLDRVVFFTAISF